MIEWPLCGREDDRVDDRAWPLGDRVDDGAIRWQGG